MIPPLQISYTWQALTLEASPFKSDKTVTYLMEKLTAFQSLGSGSSLDLSVDGEEGGGGGNGKAAAKAEGES